MILRCGRIRVANRSRTAGYTNFSDATKRARRRAQLNESSERFHNATKPFSAILGGNTVISPSICCEMQIHRCMINSV